MTKIFENHLLQDEKIIWMGKPETSVHFSPGDIFLVPSSIIWTSFAIFWEISSIKTSSFPLFSILGLSFVAIGLYLTFGRFIYKNRRKLCTHYAITNKRLLILTTSPNQTLNFKFINELTSVNKMTHNNSIGTIMIGNLNFFSSMYSNTGIYTQSDIFAFYDIKSADKVYELIKDLKSNIEL